MTNQISPSAALLIIGDEILKGRVQDSNSVYLTNQLFRRGIRTHRILTIPDSIDVIAESVKELATQYDYVITTGGVGPTHDDVTFAGVAKGMQRDMCTDSRLVEYLRNVGLNDTQARESRMANIPKGSEVYFGANKLLVSWFPLIKLNNIFVLPGIPEYVKKVFEECKDYFKRNIEFFCKEIYFNSDELLLAEKLQEIQSKWEGKVEIGSYPVRCEKYITKLTIDSVNKDCLQKCVTEIQTNLFPEYQVKLENKIESKSKEIFQTEKSKLFDIKFKEAIKVIQNVCVIYTDEEFCIAFNGGKDCTVLLYLVKIVLTQTGRMLSNIIILNINTGETFPEIEEFIEQTRKDNKLNIVLLQGNMKKVLTEFRDKYPNIRAILMGTRSIDPHSQRLHTFQSTDRDWPNFMRVMPILTWCYKDIWTFIWEHKVPYCTLYDQGYTSLGERGTTFKNPALRIVGTDEYRAAYLLEEDGTERDGRK